MAADPTVNITIYLFLAAFVLIIHPICFYSLYVIFQDWNEMFLIKRRRSIVVFIAVCCCLGLLFCNPTLLILNLVYDYPWEIPQSAYLSALLPTKFGIFAASGSLLVRVWLLYFDFNHSKVLSNKKWKMLLNDQIDISKNWFVAHRHSYGKASWLLIRANIVIILVLIIYDYLLLYAPPFWADTFAVTFFLAQTIIAVIIWKKYPSFNDVLRIRRELKRVFLCWFVILIAAYINIMVNTVLVKSVYYILWVIFAISCNYASVLYLTTIDVHRRCRGDKTNNIPMNLRYHSVNSSSPKHAQKDNYKKIIIRSWRPIIAIIEGYELFMEHLQKEFSIENLLWITEYSQFKESLIKLHPKEMDDLSEELKCKTTLPPADKLPISLIVCDYNKNNKENDAAKLFLETSNKLYGKYIKQGNAPFEVNISSSQRNSIKEIFRKYDYKEEKLVDTLRNILLRFEHAVCEIESLMNDSFSRFRRTDIAKEFWVEYIK